MHYGSADDVHDDSQEKVHNNCIPEYFYVSILKTNLPWIFGADASKAKVTDQCPYYIDAEKTDWKVGVIWTFCLVMPKRPEEFKAFVKHIDLSK